MICTLMSLLSLNSERIDSCNLYLPVLNDTGFIASGMMAGRFFSSIAWGRLADTYGRKPALISGCASISVFSVLFGVSRSLGMAVLARFLLGLFNPVW